MFRTIILLLGVLDENQGEHTMQKVNKGQLSQNGPWPSVAVLNRSRLETSSQVLHFTLSQMLLLAHWGWSFTSAQFLGWLPNLARRLLWESQRELLMGSFLLAPFSDDTCVPASWVGAASSVPSPTAELYSSNTLSQELAQSPLGLSFCCSNWECTVSPTHLVSPIWKWSCTQSPAHSGVPSMQGSCVSTKREAGVHVNWGGGNSPGCLSSSLPREQFWLSEEDLL